MESEELVSNPPAHTSLKQWPEDDRPRERLLAQGPEALSDAELLAILLRTGIRGRDAVACARDLLTVFGGLRGLGAQGVPELCKVKGLGPAKIAALLAAGEIARRRLRSDMIGKNAVRDPESVAAFLQASLRDRKIEVFKVLFLNKANRILDEQDLFRGTVDEAAVHPREIVRAALERQASAVILVHNHPSGRIEPSPEDVQITRKIRAACDTVSVRVLDHIIVGDNRHYSFCEHGLL